MSSQVNWQEADRWLIGEAWSGSRIVQHAANLCDRIGPRWGGSEAERMAAKYVRDNMAASGLTSATLEEFTLHTWRHGAAEATIVDSPWEPASPIKILPFNRTPAFDVTAPVVDAGFGTAHEIETLRDRLRGAIGVISLGNEPFTPLISMADRLKLLKGSGATACIVVDRKSGGRVEYHSASDWRDPGLDEHPLPAVATSREGGTTLRTLAAAGARIRLRTEAEFFDATSWNTVAEIQGSVYSDEHLLLGGHHDTVHFSPGGNDNASGTIAVMETARVIAAFVTATGIRPGRSLRFCTWSGEEQKLQGSAAFIRSHYAGKEFDWPASHGSGNLRRGPEAPPRFALNLDELSTGNVKGVVLNFPHMREFMQGQLDSMGEGLRCHVLEYLDPWSDHFPFALAAIDSGILWRWRFVGKHADSDYHHEHGDTSDKINVRELKEYVGYLARLLLRLSYASPQAWPSNPETADLVRSRLKRERPFSLRTM